MDAHQDLSKSALTKLLIRKFVTSVHLNRLQIFELLEVVHVQRSLLGKRFVVSCAFPEFGAKALQQIVLAIARRLLVGRCMRPRRQCFVLLVVLPLDLQVLPLYRLFFLKQGLCFGSGRKHALSLRRLAHFLVGIFCLEPLLIVIYAILWRSRLLLSVELFLQPLFPLLQPVPWFLRLLGLAADAPLLSRRHRIVDELRAPSAFPILSGGSLAARRVDGIKGVARVGLA